MFSHYIVSNSLLPHGLQDSLSFTISQSLTKLMSIESVMLSNHLILCHPLLLLPSIFPSIWVLSSESTRSIRWPNYCSFSFNISLFKEYSGLISFRIDWFDLLAIQGTLKILSPQFKSINSLVLSLLYGPILTSIHDYWKTKALTIQTFVKKWCLCLLIIHCLGLSKLLFQRARIF